MIVLDLAIAHFKRFYRNKISFGLIFIFPFFFLFIFSLALGGEDISSTTTFDLVVINNDEGIPEELHSFFETRAPNWLQNGGVGANFTNILFNATYPDQDKVSYIFHDKSDEVKGTPKPKNIIGNDTASVVIEIPQNFSKMILSVINNANMYAKGIPIDYPGYPQDVNATVLFYGNENSISFDIITSIVEAIFADFIENIKSFDSDTTLPNSVSFTEVSVLPEGEISVFDFIAAGLFVFASLLSASYFTSYLLVDEENETINRYKISLISPIEYIGGFICYSFVIMVIQTIFLFIAANLLFGFDPAGSFVSAFIVLILLPIATYALIFSAAAFFKSSDAAGNALGFGSSILGFASGAFFEMPPFVIADNLLPFTSGSPHLLVWDLIPFTHAVNAVRAIFLFDRSLGDVAGDISVMLIMSGIWFVLASFALAKKRFAISGGT
ncbi:MAG: ABC transporter permease [Candidatus Kariarchaeaceae archaeon]|jgi:ABC-2 type transport system permease protein